MPNGVMKFLDARLKLTLIHAPYAGPLINASRDKQLAVRGEVQRLNRLLLSGNAVPKLFCIPVPDHDFTVVISPGQGLPIRGKDDGVNPLLVVKAPCWFSRLHAPEEKLLVDCGGQ